MSEKLKPCPFCGGEKIVFRADEECSWCWYLCQDCRASSGKERTLADAIEAWNRRARHAGVSKPQHTEADEMRALAAAHGIGG